VLVVCTLAEPIHLLQPPTQVTRIHEGGPELDGVEREASIPTHPPIVLPLRSGRLGRRTKSAWGSPHAARRARRAAVVDGDQDVCRSLENRHSRERCIFAVG
jgi:hypothetical protein